METTVLFAFFVSMLLRAVLSLPVAQDLKSVNKTYATFDASLKRNKRQVIVGNGSCAEGQVWLLDNQICVSIEKYIELQEDDYDEMKAVSQDKKTTTHPIRPTTQATTTPHPEPLLDPDETPHPQTSSTPGPTKRPRKISRPTTTSPGAPSTARPLPLQVNRAEQTSSPHTMVTTIVFVLCVFLFHSAV